MVDKKWLKKQAEKVRKVDWIDPALYRKRRGFIRRTSTATTASARSTVRSTAAVSRISGRSADLVV